MPSKDSDQTADAQADQNLCWAHMSKDMFSDLAALMFVILTLFPIILVSNVGFFFFFFFS